MAGGWLGPALRLQGAISTGVMVAFCAAGAAGCAFGTLAQLGVLLVGVVLTGFPHGAFDHLVARPILAPRLGPAWPALFGAGYAGLAALVWLGWQLHPAATLAAFLGGSVLHFGLGDAEDGMAPDGVPRWVAVLAYGAAPVLLPVALHGQAVAPVLRGLAGLTSSAMSPALRCAAWMLPGWAACFCWVVLAARRERRQAAERLASVACFVLLPPLLAFGLYFSLGHAVRHMLRLAAWHDAHDARAAATWLAQTAVPAALVCASAILVAMFAGRVAASGLLVPGFRIIAALTLPHMVVTMGLAGPAADPQVPAAA